MADENENKPEADDNWDDVLGDGEDGDRRVLNQDEIDSLLGFDYDDDPDNKIRAFMLFSIKP